MIRACPDRSSVTRPNKLEQVTGGGHLRRGRRRQHWRRFAKDQLTLDFAAGQLTCPAGVTMPVEPGKTVRFPGGHLRRVPAADTRRHQQ
jgi:hypothetical protein